MSDKKSVLFLVHTEYHMMVALSLIADKFDDKQRYDLHIYQTENFSKTRFQFDKNVNLLNHLSYDTIKFEEREFRYNKQLVAAINTILKTSYDVFVIFNHHAFLPVFLTKQLYKKGTNIFLAPDGLKPYSNTKKLTPRWSTKTAIKFYKFLKANQLSFVWYFPTITYANLRVIQKVYVQFPETYNNITKKKVEKVSVLYSKRAKQLVNNYFKFNITNELSVLVKTIFYLNIPANDQAIYDFEIKILKELLARFPDYTLIIKLHPLTEEVQKQKFKALKKVLLITKSYPAELYISELLDSIVISFWSTACLINNKNTRVYWLYKALIKNKIMLDYVKIINPTAHIQEVEEISQIH